MIAFRILLGRCPDEESGPRLSLPAGRRALQVLVADRSDSGLSTPIANATSHTQIIPIKNPKSKIRNGASLLEYLKKSEIEHSTSEINLPFLCFGKFGFYLFYQQVGRFF